MSSDAQDSSNTNFEDAVDDVHTRFLLNLPASELQTADRIFFQIEQAWWFYEDFLGDPHPELNLPRYPSFKPFARMLFEFSPLLPDADQFAAMWEQFSNYKRKISNYGCILMTEDCHKILLCRVYNGKSYMLPAGKINQGEDGRDAAARETYEETGFDPSCQRGITQEWQENDPHRITWQTHFDEQNMLVCHEDDGAGKRRTNYVVVGVPEDFPFEPVCRKEVSAIEWFPLDNLPRATFGVMPFVNPLRKWIRKQQEQKQQSSGSRDKSSGRSAKAGRDTSNKKSTTRSNNSRGRNSNSRGGRRNNDSRGRVVQEHDNLVEAGLAYMGEASGWSEEDMFSTNERLIGRKIEYDGNPHMFAEEGLAKGDPHAFRVVGGTFLNSSGGIGSLAPPPERSLLQPLFLSDGQATKNNSSSTVEGLTPFFSSDGATPWGEVVQDAKAVMAADLARETASSTKTKSRDKSKQKQIRSPPSVTASTANTDHDDVLFLTDRQITQKSQAEKSASLLSLGPSYEKSVACVRQWVENLPKPVPTKHFGLFRLDIDAIMAQAERDVPALKPRTSTIV